MPSRMPPTTAEISARAGVSKSTVSRALRDDRRISDKTRARIAQVAATLGYAPNAIAESLATRRSSIIGFIGSQDENYWYQENVQTLVQAVAEAGMQTMMFQVSANHDISEVVPNLLRFRVAGCIIIPTVPATAKIVAALDSYGIAVVLLNRRMRNATVNSVVCDQAGGTQALARFLIAAGHRRIGFIAGAGSPSAGQREGGFVRGLAACGQSLFARVAGKFAFRDAFEAATSLFSQTVIPDAVFAANDLMAFAAIDAARGRGLCVPQDVSIVGFDNSRIAGWPGYDLTTVAQPMRAMFDHAVRLIREPGDAGARTVTTRGTLIVRGSSRVPPNVAEYGLPVTWERPVPGQSFT